MVWRTYLLLKKKKKKKKLGECSFEYLLSTPYTEIYLYCSTGW